MPRPATGSTVAEVGLELPTSQFWGTDRFAVVEALGEGAFGAVYRALDRQTGMQVALKVLRRPEPHAIYRLKKEFRSLVEIRHPNLVRLKELHRHEPHWFFTMELVEGTDLYSHVREARAATFDEVKLRVALGQLAIALRVLHAANKIHRDIKPANIRVAPGGRLVLLDFGLVSNTIDGRQTTEAGLAGTLAYMAPEQALGEQVGPAADWYSVGVVLFELLTGRLPHVRGIEARQREIVASPRELVSDVPDDLNALCMALLALEPSRRPTGEQVVLALGAAAVSERALAQPRPHALFLGREPELARLRTLLEDLQRGVPGTVHITGDSGVGKSSLLDALASELPLRWLVLRGRCFEQETVPYKAFDAIVDALSAFLLSLTDAECAALTPRRAALLPRLFPVLGRVASISTAPAPALTIDDVGIKNYAFAALREMLALIAERRPLVLVIDDIQWADADSLDLLARLLSQPDPPLMLAVLSGRKSHELSRTVQRALEQLLSAHGVQLNLEPLSDSDSQRLAQALCAAPLAPQRLAEITRESAGNPLLLTSLAKHAGSGDSTMELTLGDAIAADLRELPPGAGGLLDLVCVAAVPLSSEVLIASSSLPESTVLDLCSELCLARVLRQSGQRGKVFEPYHDRVRDAVVKVLDEATLQKIHLVLANALEQRPGTSPDVIAHHLVHANQSERAMGYAVQAAERASDGLAFARAAQLYRSALGTATRGKDAQFVFGLRVRLGDALSAAGRASEAADAYLAAAASIEGQGQDDTVRELRVRAAHRLLESGYTPRGFELLEHELRAVGVTMPGNWQMALTKLAYHRTCLRLGRLKFTPRPVETIPARELIRIDACSAASVGLVAADHLMSAYFQSLFLRLSLQSGDLHRIAYAMVREVNYASLQDPHSAWLEHVLAELDALLERVDDSKMAGLAWHARGIKYNCNGQFTEACDAFTRGHELLGPQIAEVRGDVTIYRQFELTCVQHLGRWAELQTSLESAVEDARERGDVLSVAYYQLALCPLLALARDDVLLAEEHLASSQRMMSGTEIVPIRALTRDFSQVAINLYAGRTQGLATWGRARKKAWPNAWLLRLPLFRSECIWVRARALLGEMTVVPFKDSDAREAYALARELDAVPLPFAKAYASMTRGCVEAARDDSAAAVTYFEQAEAIFEQTSMGMLLNVARMRKGMLMGAAGVEIVRSAERFMLEQRIKRPRQIAQIYAPLRADVST